MRVVIFLRNVYTEIENTSFCFNFSTYDRFLNKEDSTVGILLIFVASIIYYIP